MTYRYDGNLIVLIHTHRYTHTLSGPLNTLLTLRWKLKLKLCGGKA